MNHKLKILIINIALRPDTKKVLFPIGLGYITTAIYNSGFNFKILDLDKLRLSDDQLEEYLKNEDFNVVAMGCIVTGYKIIKKISKLVKKYKNIPIIVGNSVASSIPDTLMKKTDVDIGVMMEGDETIIDLLKTIENNTNLEDVKGIFFKKNGNIVFTSKREPIKDINRLPMIKYDLFDTNFYLDKCKLNLTEPYPMAFEKIRVLPINTARGCPFSCTFCYHVFKNEKYRVRSVENIGKEIKFLKKKYKINYVQFYDELTLFNKKRVNEIADYFIKNDLGIFWSGDCRAGLFKEEDLPLALKLKKSGCCVLGYSLESANEEILKSMNKHIKIKDFSIQTKILLKAGITPVTSLVIGFPQETPETLKKTFDFCYDCGIYPSTGYLLPQPGTKIYENAIKTGKIADEEEYLLNMGDRQDFRINLTNMKQEEIEYIVKKNLRRISNKLNLGLAEKNLIKTGHYIQKKENSKKER